MALLMRFLKPVVLHLIIVFLTCEYAIYYGQIGYKVSDEIKYVRIKIGFSIIR